MPPVDLTRLREASMADEEFLREIVDLFLDDTPKQLNALRQAIEAQDSSGVRTGAHRLKGASVNIGAQPFSNICWKLEQIGKQGQLEQAPMLLRDLDSEFRRLQDFLTHLPA